VPTEHSASEKPRRLGRGLEALLGGGASSGVATTASGDGSREVLIERIRPNPYQPRREFPAAELAELQASIEANGLLQPIALRPAGDGFELIAGERRLRAAKALGWSTIPAVIRHLGAKDMLTLALVENLQRTDLNPIEEADGYYRLQEDFGLTQQQIALAVGKDRSTVANLLRLRQLPDSIRQMVRDSRLTIGHARALLAIPANIDLQALAERIVAESLTVRDVERLARPVGEVSTASDSSNSSTAPISHPTSAQGGAEMRRIVDQLRRHLQTDVVVRANLRAQGEIRIKFYSADDLDRVLALILHSEL
jgi:ParB family chromosome partitioning protein